MKMQRGEGEAQPETPHTAVHFSRKRLEQLARPIQHRIYRRGGIAPEPPGPLPAKTPGLEDNGDGDWENFLDRMECAEEERRQKLARAAAEARYDARADKKVCSRCGAAQSYDEMAEGKTRCPRATCQDGGSYQPPAKFDLAIFKQRMERSRQRRSLVLDRVEEERRSSIERTCQKKTQRQRALQEKVSRGEGNDFEARMHRDIAQRKEKIRHLAEHRVELLSKEYTFTPKLNVKEELLRHRKGGWESLATPLRRHTEEYRPPHEEGRGTKKRRRRRRRRPGAPRQKDLDENKLRQSFQRQIM